MDSDLRVSVESISTKPEDKDDTQKRLDNIVPLSYFSPSP